MFPTSPDYYSELGCVCPCLMRRFDSGPYLRFHVTAPIPCDTAGTVAMFPASTTHSQLTPEEQAKTGVTDGYVRLSVGIEHIDDIMADLDQALAAA